jgi:DnaJ family protein C protein 3
MILSKILVISLINLAIIFANTSEHSSKSEVDGYLEVGIKLLAAGQLADALSQFHMAIDVDPSNYVSFYRRGTVYLGMGKFKAALSDLNRVIELKPDFHSARMQRANVLLKQGNFKEAINDLETIVNKTIIKNKMLKIIKMFIK